MERTFPRYKIATAVLVIFYAVGWFGFNQESWVPLFIQLVPYNLLLTAALLFPFHQNLSRNFLIYSLLVALLGYSAEWVGVHTGLLFGDYSYGRALGIKLFDIPLLIGLNWVILSYCTTSIASRISTNTLVSILISAALMTGLDWCIEPVAVSFDYWHWEQGIIPFSNYIGWFVVSIITASLFYLFKVNPRNPMAISVFIIQLVFFLLFRISGL